MKKQLQIFLLLVLLSISCNQEEGVVNTGGGSGTTGFTMLVTSPVGGETFNVGDIKTIKWTSNTTNRVKIEFTTDAGANWTILASNVPNSGTYNWTPIPNSPSVKCLVRVSDMNDATVTDISDNFFSIQLVLQKSISLTKPNLSSDTLFVGKTYKIQWTSSNVPFVKIDYTTNNGTNWNNITTTAIGDSGYYNWVNVPNTPSSQCKIKISDASADTITDQSEQNFPIIFTQQITILSPNGGETLSKGGAHNILWSSTDISNVKIEYTPNNGSTWVTIANSTNAAIGSYTWNPIPDIVSNNCKVRISDASDGIPSTESASTFSIASQPSITVMQPNGGDTLEVGGSFIIQWVSTAPNKPKFINEEVRSVGNSQTAIERVRIDYSTNNGSSWIMIATNVSNSGSYTWNNIPNTATTQGRIKVSDADDGSPSDSSDGTFIIQTPPPKSLTLTSPIGGEIWEATSNHAITWTSTNISFLKIEFSSNNGQSYSTIAQSVPASNGSYDWTVPSTISNKCLIRISDLSNSNFKSQSNTVFTILPSPSIIIIQPNGGEELRANGSYNIIWTSENVVNVLIEYTTNNGVNWSTIVASTESDGFYTWTPIPNLLSTNCKIRISDAADGFPVDLSDNVFKILVEPQLKITSPNGGERLLAGSNSLIQWSTLIPGKPLKNNERISKGKGFQTDDETSIANVKLEYTTNGGADWTTIVSTTPNSGTYVWSPIPNANSSLCKVRVSDASDGYPVDLSDSTFVIYNQLEQSLQVTAPNGGEVLSAGTNFGITWLSSGIASVNIEYTTNNGVNWNVIVNGTESDGFYLWNPVPNISSTNCKVRISDATDSIPSDMSDNTFTILPQPSVTVISPNGGEDYLSGSTQLIKWSSQNLEKVKIEYTTNNGATWSTVTDSTVSIGSYSWTVPSANSSLCKIKISDPSDGIPVDISDSTFTISNQPVQSLRLSSPNGGEQWIIGTSRTITWSSVGIDSVKIEFTTNNGQNWSTISSGTPSNGLYVWNPIPNVQSNNCKVRVSDVTDGFPVDLSDSLFSIMQEPVIQVTAPNGGERLLAGTSYSITWNTTLFEKKSRSKNNFGKEAISQVKIELSTDEGLNWSSVADNILNVGAYLWNPIPSINSSLCRIKISDREDGIPFDISDSNFVIYTQASQNIVVVSPNGGENLNAGGSHNITWTSSGVSSVNIEYTTNNGVSWATVVNGTESDGFYIWNPIPNVASTNCKIKISDATDSIPSSTSANTFTIVPAPSISVISPNGGESFTSGNSTLIRWTSANIANVKIELTSNNGASWSSISDSTLSSGSYSWTIPSVNSSLCKIRITNLLNGLPVDESDSAFAITTAISQSLTVTSPNGNQIWAAGTSQTITWNSSGIDSVKIEFTSNNGQTWNTIAAKTESDGFYTWNPVPNISSTNCKVRISDASDGFPVDLSDNTFTISPEPEISVLSPNGNESWSFGSNQNIRWTSTNIEKVKIEFTTNNGFSWTTITDSTESIGNYIWTVPNVNSSLCKVKISDSRDGVPFDLSDSNFTITNQISQSISVAVPNGGETWESGTTQNITWSGSGIQDVKIEFTTDNGLTWTSIVDSTVSDGFYEWNNIPSLSSTLCKIKISDEADGFPSDESDATFSIVPSASITVTYPNGGESLIAGNPYTITWTSVGISNVLIQSSSNNGSSWDTLVISTPSDGSYQTSFSVAGTAYKIKISDAVDGNPVDESDGTFIVLPEPSVTVISPNGGESLASGSISDIRWSSTNLVAVKIELTTNNGASWTSIIDSTASDGSYLWTVSSLNSSACKIRVSDYSDGAPQDQSDASFTIYTQVPEAITVTSPNGNETFIAGSSQAITWQSTGIDSVKIEYTTNNGQTWSTIIASTMSDGFYVWNPVPAVASTNCKVKISDASDGYPSDQSDATFTISPEPGITIIAPNGGDTLIAGSSFNVRWSSAYITAVKIEYTSNNGASWTSITDSTTSDGIYAWTVPSITSQLCKIRISDEDDGLPSDLSDTTFMISVLEMESITVIAPNGSETWAAGTSQTITWSSSGIDSVKIEYTSNNGQTWNTIVAQTESDGFYTWNPVPSVTSTNCKIKISDASDGDPYDQSDATFTLSPEPGITIIAPNGGDTLVAASSYNIRWSSTYLTAVKIEYTSNNGASWNSISDSTESDGIYLWTVPSITSQLCKIRISDEADGLPSDLSDTTFAISVITPQSLTVTSPDGGENIPAGSSFAITWTSTSIANVKIEYSTSGGNTWATITDSTLSDGYYLWDPLPNVTSNNCLIRISDEEDGTPSDVSNSYFNIIPGTSIKVLKPNGGESISYGTYYNVTWTSQNLAAVKIEFTTNNGASWTSITDSAASIGSYLWSVPNLNSNLCRVRISDYFDGAPSDISDTNFTITNQVIQELTLTSPNGGEQWEATSSQQITWLSTGIEKVKIEFTTNNGLAWTTITDSTESDGLYEWSIPNTAATLCKIRVSDHTDGTPLDESDSVFSITLASSIVITYPNGGENLIAGQLYSLTWNSVGVTNVKIETSSDNGIQWVEIISSTPSDGSFDWSFSIPSAFTRIKISDAQDAIPSDVSDGSFTVSPEPSITVLTPNGGQVLAAGSLYDITWSSINLSDVKIELTSNNGSTWSSIIDSTESDGIYTWTIPSLNSSQCKIRISDEADGLPSDVSDATFRIYSAIPETITVVAPNGGDTLSSGNPYSILWTSTGIDSVKIEYSVNNGVSFTTIVSSTPSDGQYTWFPVPSTFSNNCIIKISDAEDGFPIDMSNSVFAILGEPIITVTQPNGGEAWIAGVPRNIRWTSQNVAAVKIEYSTNNGATWTSIVDSTASDGLYEWSSVANVHSAQCRIKISDEDDGIPYDISDNNFSILSQSFVRVIFPNGGEIVQGDTVFVYSSFGVDSVTLEITYDNAATGWTTLVADTPSTGAYRFRMPGQPISSNARFRVTDNNDTTIRDMSDATFYLGFVPPGLVISMKRFSENINDERYILEYAVKKGVEHVDIYYSVDDGSTWKPLLTNAKCTGELNEFIIEKKPDDMKGNVFFRIGDQEGNFGEPNVIKIE